MTGSLVPSLKEEAQLMEIIKGWETMQLTYYVQMTGHALIVVDYLQTLPDEIKLMWPTALSLPKILFLTLRYSIFIAHFIAVYFSAVIVVLISEVVLFVRVYAFSGGKRKMMIYLIVQYLALHVPTFTLLVIFMKGVVYTELPIPICLPVELQYNLNGGSFALIFVSALVVMVLMAHTAYNKHKHSNSTLLSVFYRDGVYYFVSISVLSMINCIISFAAPLAYKFMFIQLEVDFHVILTTRMLIHLRKWAQRDEIVIQGDHLPEETENTADQFYLSDLTKRSLATIQF